MHWLAKLIVILVLCSASFGAALNHAQAYELAGEPAVLGHVDLCLEPSATNSAVSYKACGKTKTGHSSPCPQHPAVMPTAEALGPSNASVLIRPLGAAMLREIPQGLLLKPPIAA